MKGNHKMNFNSRGLTRNVSFCLLISYFLTFIVYYLANYIFYGNSLLAYFQMILNKATYLMIPFTASLTALIISSFVSTKSAFISLIPFSLTRIIYSLPLYYLVFMYDYFDTADSLLLSTLVSILECAVIYVLSLGAFLIMSFIIRKAGRAKSQAEVLTEKTPLDFKHPVSLAFAIISLSAFAVIFIKDTVSIAELISSSGANLKISEIFYVVFLIIYDAILLFLHYFLLSFIKNTVVKKRMVKSEILD